MSIGRIVSATTQGQAVVDIAWDDGAHRQIDLEPVIAVRTALAPLRDFQTFHQMCVAEDGWSVEWPACGIELGAAQLRRWAGE